MLLASILMQFDYPHIYTKYCDWIQEQGHTVTNSTSTATESLQSYAAQTIQSWWRKIAHAHREIGLSEASSGVTTSRDVKDPSATGATAVIIVAGGGGVGGRSKPRRKLEKLSVHTAAMVIQRAWRRHNVCYILCTY